MQPGIFSQMLVPFHHFPVTEQVNNNVTVGYIYTSKFDIKYDKQAKLKTNRIDREEGNGGHA